MLKKLQRRIVRNEKGITGLETAIILIAFVVVASVFAYTVLSAGIFSSQKGKEAIYSGLDQARSSLALKGNVVGMGTPGSPGTLDQVVFTVGNALNGEAIDLTPPTDDSGMAADGSSNVTVISYQDQEQRLDDLSWTVKKLGDDDGDDLLEPGEKFEITVNLGAVSPTIGPYTTFAVEVKPPKGSVLVIQQTTPAIIDTVMILN